MAPWRPYIIRSLSISVVMCPSLHFYKLRSMSCQSSFTPIRYLQGLYAVNNYLKFAMQLFFKPTTTKMLGNLKVFTIALLLRIVMNRQFNIIQVRLNCLWG